MGLPKLENFNRLKNYGSLFNIDLRLSLRLHFNVEIKLQLRSLIIIPKLLRDTYFAGAFFLYLLIYSLYLRKTIHAPLMKRCVK